MSLDFGKLRESHRLDDDFNNSSIAFSLATSRRDFRVKLPSIKLKNRHAVRDLLINEEEAERLNKSIEVSGPTPGIYSLAAARRNLKPDFSFKRVGIKSSVLSTKRLLLN